MNSALENIRIQKWVATLSVILLVVKIVAYYLTNSVAIFSDALEGMVNVVAGFLGLYSLYVSAKPRDADHPYGHGKIEFISAAVEGSMIGVAGILIIIESVKGLFNPKQIIALDLGILLLLVTAIANLVVGTICVRVGNKNNSLALIASGRHLQTDVYSTVGVLVGLGLIYITKIEWLDSAVALIFSLIILFTAFHILRKSFAGIMDERDKELLERMVTLMDQQRSKNWMDVHNIRIIKYGSVLHIDCHLTVPWYLNVHEAHTEIDKLSNIIRKEFGDSIELFVHSDGCLPISCPICIKDDCHVRQHPFEKRIRWTIQNIASNEKHQITTSD